MKKNIFLCLLAGTAGLWAADPAGFSYWPGAALEETQRAVAAKVDPKTKTASQALGKFGNHSFILGRREANGEAEIHEKLTDLFLIRAGAAKFIIGGQLKDPKTTGPGEIRAASIEGGREIQVGPGDMLNIPPNTPHQTIVAPGGSVTYMVVKIDAQ